MKEIKLTHRKSIIIALTVIAESALVLTAIALFKGEVADNIMLGLIGITSNIVSVMAGIYIGKTKEDQSQ